MYVSSGLLYSFFAVLCSELIAFVREKLKSAVQRKGRWQ